MNFKEIKSFIRKLELLFRVDHFAARYLPLRLRHYFVPPPYYYNGGNHDYFCDGVCWRIDPSRHTQHKILLGGCEESLSSAFSSLSKCDKKGPISVLDIGANTGGFSLPLAVSVENHSNIRIHAFEPEPVTFARLEEQLTLNPNLKGVISVINSGIGEQQGELSLSVPKRSDGLASFSRNYDNELSYSVVVPVTTVDEYALAEGIQIAFMKIDVEGFEASVLRGASRVLSKQKPDVFCEMIDDDCDAARILKSHGYQVARRFEHDILWRI